MTIGQYGIQNQSEHSIGTKIRTLGVEMAICSRLPAFWRCRCVTLSKLWATGSMQRLVIVNEVANSTLRYDDSAR